MISKQSISKIQSICSTAIAVVMIIIMSGFNYTTSDSVQIPVLKVNFYLMGMDEVEQQVPLSIGENIKYLNEEFEDAIEFELNELFLEPNGAFLPDIHSSILTGDKSVVRDLLNPIEKKGAINVYIFDTYCLEGTDQALTGFTPIMSTNQQAYAKASPRFDRIYISYSGLESQSTLVHEMGHFLGLKHPWELTTIQKLRLGINAHNLANNHMTYDQDVSSFTRQQLELMRNNAMKYRSYMITKTKRLFNRA